MKYFMGKVIPDTTQGAIDAMRPRVKRDPKGSCSEIVQGITRCVGIECRKCVFSCINAYERWRFLRGDDPLPEEIEDKYTIASGQLYKIAYCSNYFMCVNPNLVMALGTAGDTTVTIRYQIDRVHDASDITEVFATPTTATELYMLVSGDPAVNAVRRIRKMEESAKEMTVAELEEKLGYKIKIVKEK